MTATHAPAKRKRDRPIGTAATTRLRRIACEHECGYVARVSRTVMLTGIATCPCGGRILPSALEDLQALALAGHVTQAEVDEHPEAIAFRIEYDRMQRGRTGSRSTAGTPLAKTAKGRESADNRAWQRVLDARVTDARDRRLAALNPAGARADTDPIPF